MVRGLRQFGQDLRVLTRVLILVEIVYVVYIVLRLVTSCALSDNVIPAKFAKFPISGDLAIKGKNHQSL